MTDEIIQLRPLGPRRAAAERRKDPTAAERKRRSRAKKRREQVTLVTPAIGHDVTTVTAPVTAPVMVGRHEGRGVTIATTIAALRPCPPAFPSPE
jgi:hypothetical protein